MKNVCLMGNWEGESEILNYLLIEGYKLEYFLPNDEFWIESNLLSAILIVSISKKEDIPLQKNGWFAYIKKDDPGLTISAYEAGAKTVFPINSSASLIVKVLNQQNSTPDNKNKSGTVRKVKKGEPIFLEPNDVLLVHNGILATTMIHGDGAQVLLGLTGKGQVLISHPDDECFIQTIAHTDSEMSIYPWEMATTIPHFNEKLKKRLQQMEAWSAMQARPYLDQRVLGILSILAEQFGLQLQEGVQINIKITHAQLASAVGATRTTITRIMGELKSAGKISIDAKKDKNIVLHQGIKFNHL